MNVDGEDSGSDVTVRGGSLSVRLTSRGRSRLLNVSENNNNGNVNDDDTTTNKKKNYKMGTKLAHE